MIYLCIKLYIEKIQMREERKMNFNCNRRVFDCRIFFDRNSDQLIVIALPVVCRLELQIDLLS